MVQAARDDLPGRVLQRLPDRLHDHGQHFLAVLLDPPRLRVAVDLVAPRFADRPQALVEQGGLDAGRSLVHAEHQP
jgi:hypothetical protein